MVNEDRLGATTGMTYRMQGAVTALDEVLGSDASLLDYLANSYIWKR